MNQPTITISASTIDKFAALGRAMLDLAHELKGYSNTAQVGNVDLTDVPADQRWYWTPEWQAMEKEADEAEQEGRYQEFATAEEAIAYLHRQV